MFFNIFVRGEGVQAVLLDTDRCVGHAKAEDAVGEGCHCRHGDKGDQNEKRRMLHSARSASEQLLDLCPEIFHKQVAAHRGKSLCMQN